MNDLKIEVLRNFDQFLIKNSARPFIAADRLSCIVGVLVDVKPACIVDFSKHDVEDIRLREFEKYLKLLGLTYVYEKTNLNSDLKDVESTHSYYISKNKETVNMLLDAEHELYDLFDSAEPNSPVIKIIHQKIGRLLGYPETATEWFLVRSERINQAELDEDDIFRDLQKYHHFIHSRSNADEEFNEYDKPIHEAMEKYTPLSAKIMRENSGEKRWL